VPDIKTEDDYHLDENGAETVAAPVADREFSRGLVYLLLWLNSAVLIFSCGMILWVILSTVGMNEGTANRILAIGGAVALAAAAACWPRWRRRSRTTASGRTRTSRRPPWRSSSTWRRRPASSASSSTT
jgi:type VI protein secretion system component VasK